MVDSGGETPGPIPNPEAKPTRADGTALGRVWESKLPPTKNFINSRLPVHTGFGSRLFFRRETRRLLKNRVRNGHAGPAFGLEHPVFPGKGIGKT